MQTETLADLAARQTVVPKWLSDLVAEHGPDAPVKVQRKDTPFGTFVLGVEVLK